MDQDIINMIDELLLEHEELIVDVQALEHMASDFGVALQLDKATEGLVVGRLEGHQDALKALEKALAEAETKLQAHFNREERGLLQAFEKSRKQVFASALHDLLLEHNEIRTRLDNSKRELEELWSAGLSRDVWEGKVWGIRVYIAHTRRLIEDHAHAEYALLWKARGEMTGPEEK